jgi:hypothetical protein
VVAELGQGLEEHAADRRVVLSVEAREERLRRDSRADQPVDQLDAQVGNLGRAE